MEQLASTNGLPSPSFNATCASSASTGAATMRPSITTSFIRSGHLNVYPLHHVIVIAGRVEDQLLGLCTTGSVCSPGHDRMSSWPRGWNHETPLTPAEAAQICPQLGSAPGTSG